MISKDFILSEIDNLKDMIENSKKLNCGTIIKACEEEIEQYQQVLKDLETLDILKENAHLYVNNVNKDVKSIQINITTCDDNFNKVEGWLNNER